MGILDILLPIVYIVVGAALVWFVIELALTVRKARGTVKELDKSLAPTLESVQKMTAAIEPVTAKVDPLVDRVSLTVDAANLEIMRVDQILEDVTQITGSVTKTMDAVGTITNAPLDLVTSVTDKVRSRLKGRDASSVSVQLGAAEGAAAKAGVVKDMVDTASEAAADAMAEQRDKRREQKAAQTEKRQAAEAETAKMNGAAVTLTDAIVDAADEDAAR